MIYYNFEEAKHYVDFEMTTEAKPGDPVAVSVMPDGTKLLGPKEVANRPVLALKGGKLTWDDLIPQPEITKPEGER